MTNRNILNVVRKSAVFLMLAAVAASTQAHAQQPLLPEGQTMITLSVTERISVEQDVLTASLRMEIEDSDATEVQRQINTAMEEALQRARSIDEVSQSTGYYNVYQYDRQPQGGRAENIWRGSQSLTLEGKDAQALLALAGELQGMGFVMNQLSYHLSTERADEVRDSLMEAAITRVSEKAERATRALGKSQFDIAVLDIDTSSNSPSPVMMRSMAADTAEMAPPSAEAGLTEVTLNVRIQAVAR